MPIKSFKTVPTNTAEWERFFRGTLVTPSANSVSTTELQVDAVATNNVQDEAITTLKLADGDVTNPKLAAMPALSLKANPTNSNGVPDDLLAATDGDFCVRRAGQLVFDPLVDGDIPATLARQSYVNTGDAAVTTAFEAADTALEAAILVTTDGRYVALSNVLGGSGAYDPPSLTDGSEASTTVTVTGAVLGDFALASFSLSTQGIKLAAEVTAANTVTVNFHNKTGGTLDLASGTLRARVWKQ